MTKPYKKRKKRKEQLSKYKPKDLTDSSFLETIKKYKLAVVDFWAPWCTPCFPISAIIEDLAKDYAGKIFFGKYNLDKNFKISAVYGIMSIPTLLIFKKGNLIDGIIGTRSRQEIESIIVQYLGTKKEEE